MPWALDTAMVWGLGASAMRRAQVANVRTPWRNIVYVEQGGCA